MKNTIETKPDIEAFLSGFEVNVRGVVVNGRADDQIGQFIDGAKILVVSKDPPFIENLKRIKRLMMKILYQFLNGGFGAKPFINGEIKFGQGDHHWLDTQRREGLDLLNSADIEGVDHREHDRIKNLKEGEYPKLSDHGFGDKVNDGFVRFFAGQVDHGNIEVLGKK